MFTSLRREPWAGLFFSFLLVGVGCGGNGSGVGDEPRDSGEVAQLQRCGFSVHTDAPGPLVHLLVAGRYCEGDATFLAGPDGFPCRAAVDPPRIFFSSVAAEPQLEFEDWPAPRCAPEDLRYLNLVVSKGAGSSGTGFASPGPGFVCDAVAASAEHIEAMDFEILDASDGSFDVAGSAWIDGLSCDSKPEGSTTTTTTLPVCGEDSCASGFSCLDGACVEGELFEVDFHLDETVKLGALQWYTESLAEGVSFLGFPAPSGEPRVQCDIDPRLTAISVMNIDHEDSGRPVGVLVVAMIAGGPLSIDGPGRVVSCRIASTSGAPAPSDFQTVVEDVSDPDARPVPTPTVRVSAVRPIGS